MMFRHAIICAVLALTVFAAQGQLRRKLYPGALDAHAVCVMEEQRQARSSDGQSYINAIVEFEPGTDEESVAAKYNIRLNVRAGGMISAVIPLCILGEFAADEGVKSVSLGASLREMCDEASRLTGVDRIHAGLTPSGVSYDGTGVIVGIIDSGFDFMHSAFRDTSGKSRISVVWDQNRVSSASGVPSEYGYGVVLDNSIDIEKVVHDSSSDTHGTHVAAIAVSSSSLYGGMAPGAEIAIVSTNRSEAGIIDGLDFLLDYAERKGKPLAVNISMGTVIGFKDGNDRLALMIDRMLDGSKGKIVAIAAGNEGHRRSTIVSELRSAEDEILTRMQLPSYDRENLFVGSSEGDFTLTISFHEKDGSEIFSLPFASDATASLRIDGLKGADDSSFIVASASREPASSVSVNLYCPLEDGQYWQAKVTGSPARYILTADYGELSEGSDATTIACTACGRNTIPVGAYVSRTSYINIDGKECESGLTYGEEYPLSGKGPTFDGRKAPVVFAPGAAVISAINSYASSFSIDRSTLVKSCPSSWFDNHTDFWGAMSGTSMATPVVTGILALWLQSDPTLTAERVLSLIDGMDKIDAMAGLSALSAGIGSQVKCDNFQEGDIYDIGGRLLYRSVNPEAITPSLAPGIYILHTPYSVRKFIVGT